MGITVHLIAADVRGVGLFPQHLIDGLLNFRRRVCRSFWLDFAFRDPPWKRWKKNKGRIYVFILFFPLKM